MTKRIIHLSFSSSGGAGIVAKRLIKEQINLGHDSELMSMTDHGLASIWKTNPPLFLKGSIDYFIVRKSRDSNLFTLLRDSNNFDSSLITEKEYDVIHLHWTPGLLSFSDIRTLLESEASIVWTLHDANPFTGGCHHTNDCVGYFSDCNACPQVRDFFQTRVKEEFSTKKSQLVGARNKIKFVAPSLWMHNLAINSPIIIGNSISIIPNPIDCEIFVPINASKSPSEFVIGCSAINLSDPMKGILEIKDGAMALAKRYPLSKFKVLAIGGGEDSFKHENFEFVATGSLADVKEISAQYQQMDIFVTMSKAETFPNTILEAMATGLPIIARNQGGMADLVQQNQAGVLVENESDLIIGLEKLYLDSDQRLHTGVRNRNSALDNYSQEVVARKYLDLYGIEN